jgi:predicted alpha/beta-hydrolase family hydrolase
MSERLIDGRDDAAATLILAHGAGAGMDTPFMTYMAEGVAARGFQVVRFEFPYMQARRKTGKKTPPPRADKLIGAFADEIGAAGTQSPVFIGGKSMGGRIATLLAAQADLPDALAGVVALGYPFHPPGKPESRRTDHLYDIAVPLLICQGSRDPFGSMAEVQAYGLPGDIAFCWLEDGNHDLAPRKASGLTTEQNWQAAVRAMTEFMAERS